MSPPTPESEPKPTVADVLAEVDSPEAAAEALAREQELPEDEQRKTLVEKLEAATVVQRTFEVAEGTVQLALRDGGELVIEAGKPYTTDDPQLAGDLAGIRGVTETTG
jgi:hypothetical protein